MTERRFAPQGPLALDPKAFGMLLLMPYQPVTQDRGGVTVLSVRGPINQFRDVFCESYESIVERVDAALAARPKALVLSIASPGGVVSGCFEAADRIRSAAKAAGVPLIAYADGTCASAAYALACAADRIVAPATATVGSIGVIAEVRDTRAADAMQGVSVSLLRSGELKAAGNPHESSVGPMGTALQAQVDRQAMEFYAYVGARRGLPADAVRALQANVFIGSDAQAQGLTDATQTLDELVASLTATTSPAAPIGVAEEETDMSKETVIAPSAKAAAGDDDKDYEAAIATLRKRAAAGDEKAKRMLAELADASKEDGEPDGDEPRSDAAPDSSPTKKDEGGAAASASAQAQAALVAAHAAHRESLFAQRPDISPELRASLEQLDPAAVKRVLDATPRRAMNPAAAAGADVRPTRGEGQGGAPEPTAEVSEIDVRMGVHSGLTEGVRRVDGGRRLIFGQVPPAK